jgi:hypothetical protein
MFAWAWVTLLFLDVIQAITVPISVENEKTQKGFTTYEGEESLQNVNGLPGKVVRIGDARREKN